MFLLKQTHGSICCWEQTYGIFLEVAWTKGISCFATAHSWENMWCLERVWIWPNKQWKTLWYWFIWPLFAGHCLLWLHREKCNKDHLVVLWWLFATFTDLGPLSKDLDFLLDETVFADSSMVFEGRLSYCCWGVWTKLLASLQCTLHSC